MIHMGLINIHMKDEEKKKLQGIIEANKDKSMSVFIRKALAEKIKLEEFASANFSQKSIIIPDYIPKNKYVAFVNGAVIGVGNTVSEVAQIAAEKFPSLPLVIKFNGPKKHPIEYVYMSFSEPKCWKYAEFDERTYPIIPLSLLIDSQEKQVFASFDSAASICVMREKVTLPTDFRISRKEQISTAAGIVEMPLYETTIRLLEQEFKIEFIMAPISDSLPFNFLIGRNLMDQLDVYFFGKKQILMLKMPD
jgi:hypothetical protein